MEDSSIKLGMDALGEESEKRKLHHIFASIHEEFLPENKLNPFRGPQGGRDRKIVPKEMPLLPFKRVEPGSIEEPEKRSIDMARLYVFGLDNPLCNPHMRRYDVGLEEYWSRVHGTILCLNEEETRYQYGR